MAAPTVSRQFRRISTAAGTLYRTFASPLSTITPNTFWGSVEFKGQATIKFQNFYQLIFSDTPNTGGSATTTTGLVDPLGTANGVLSMRSRSSPLAPLR